MLAKFSCKNIYENDENFRENKQMLTFAYISIKKGKGTIFVKIFRGNDIFAGFLEKN
jgi:hypothetical protein